MAIPLRSVLMEQLDELRFEPTAKRIRAVLDGQTVIDTTRALLVWEPKRVVPTYAVPVSDVDADLVDVQPGEHFEQPEGVPVMGVPLGERRVYDPSIPFAVHTTDGAPLALRVRGSAREAAAFRSSDAALDGYVIVDFDGFDAWLEEDEVNVGHPKDPFHRIDILHSSREVRIELDGEVLAESTNVYFLFEPPLPVRYYFPIADVRTDLFTASSTITHCAYKGEASYLSLADESDVAWVYEAPLRDAEEVRGRIAFFNERLDVIVDGEVIDRPVTPWSRR